MHLMRAARLRYMPGRLPDWQADSSLLHDSQM